MIDITGVDLVEFAKAVYDLSRPQGMGFLHYKEGPLSDAEAAQVVGNPHRSPSVALCMDYVFGRACKMTVFRNGDNLEIHERWYDHSPEDLQELLRRVGIAGTA